MTLSFTEFNPLSQISQLSMEVNFTIKNEHQNEEEEE